MKAVILEAFNDQLKLGEVPKPQISDQEVLIEIKSSGVNPVDYKICKGLLEGRLPHEFPLIPGWDASGVIKEVGKNAKHVKVGEEVYCYCRKPVVQNGTYAEFINVDAENVASKPSNLDFSEAAAIPLASLTAWQALFEAANLKKGQTILVHAGAGGVGGFAIQFAKHIGAKVITTASLANHAYCKKLGADECIDYKKGDLVKQLKKIAPEGVDVVFDTVGGDTLKQSYSLVKKDGVLVSIVQRPEEKTGIRTEYVFVRPDGKQLSEIGKLIENGKVVCPKIQELPLKDFKKALDQIMSVHTKGKIVLKIK
jgi:NADPH:quinone reductase-like Zn-dependent oxidoreductase